MSLLGESGLQVTMLFGGQSGVVHPVVLASKPSFDL